MSMGKVQVRHLKRDERETLEAELWEALHALKRSRDIVPFLRDLLTPSEIVMFARRIRTAKFLLRGMSHKNIRWELHVGFPTIQAVDRWLKADFKDYRPVLSELYEKACREERRREPAIAGTFRHLRKKYPLHFLLFNLLLQDV